MLNFESTHVTPYIVALIEEVQPNISKAELISSYEVDPELVLTADLHWMARAVTNLLSNACKFASHNIFVKVHELDQYIVIDIEDDGPGIPKDVQERIFDAFYRPDEGRTRAYGGAGLGLAIVRRIQQWHEGDCQVQDSMLGGVKFTLRYPRHDR